MSTQYVIIGNGIAGVSAARAIRDRDPTGSITVLGDEGVFPYNRIMLSKQLMQAVNPDAMLLQNRDWYREMKIQLHNSSRAVRLDLDNHLVVVADGQTVSFDRLLLATGARNRVPPVQGVDGKGIYSIRQVDDVMQMHETLENSRRVVLIGGGIQGLETAWTLIQKAKEVILIEAAKRLMPRLLDEQASQILLENMEEKGIQVHLGAWVERIDPGTPLRCILSSGDKIEGDAVIYATGIVPNGELAAGTPLSAGEGIGVDEYLATAVPDVYAAGDVIQCQGMVCGLWNTAAVQGRIAGLNMAGDREVYRPLLPVTILNAFGVSLFSMGQPFVREGGWTVEEVERGSNRYVRVFLEEDRPVGAIVMGDRGVIPKIKDAVEKKKQVISGAGRVDSIGALLDQLQ